MGHVLDGTRLSLYQCNALDCVVLTVLYENNLTQIPVYITEQAHKSLSNNCFRFNSLFSLGAKVAIVYNLVVV